MEALQITPGERRVMISLMGVNLILLGFALFGPTRTIYDEEYYQPVIEEFRRLSAMDEEEQDALFARYKPPLEDEVDPRSLLGDYQIAGEVPKILAAGLAGTRDDNGDRRGEERVNIQIADRDELMSLSGIGPVTADRIVRYRLDEGPFTDPDDLLNVSGIGPVTLDNIRELIYVE